MNKMFKYYLLLGTLLVLACTQIVDAQFYRGMYQEFGKNRLQFFEPNWQHMDFEEFNVYFYGTGRPLAEYTTHEGKATLKRLEKILDYRMRGKVYILIFNTQSEFEQSNVGLELPDSEGIGGTTRLQGNKLFVYFNGSHKDLQRQIRGGLTQVVVNQMMFGNNWKEMVKNSALMSIPDWYLNGIVSYATQNWSVDVDDKLRDLVLNGQMGKFNRLTGADATFAGHALWYYISEVYGPEVIPNILYMSKISRNIESGFLFVLGKSLDNLVESAQKYYLAKYVADDAQRKLPKSDPLKIKTKKSRTYQRISLSPNAEYVAFTSNELGQYKVWLHDVAKKKTKRLMRGDHKLDRIPDVSYPLLAWNPSSEVLAVIYSKKGKVLLELFDMQTKKWDKRELVRIDKVLSFNFSSDGRRLVISGIKNSQSDLFVFNLAQNSMQQVTNDIYDDLTPSFIPGTNEIIFASNRASDSTKFKKDADLFMDNNDLFIYDYKEKPDVYKRLVNSQDYDEQFPYAINANMFTFLSGENGIRNRYVGSVDSTISYIDTTIHYRYFTETTPVSNYKRNILYQSISISDKKYAEMIKYKGKYKFYIEDFKSVTEEEVEQTGYRETVGEKIKAKERLNSEKAEQFAVIDPPDRDALIYKNDSILDINNYMFEGDIRRNPQKPNGPIKDSKLITLKTVKTEKVETTPEVFKFPKQENYRLAFVATDITTAADFDFANQLYQPFNGGPYNNPGMGVVVKISMFDLMEDHSITGGMRYGFNGNSTEYFLNYTNRRKRLDKTYGFQRQKLKQNSAEGYPIESIIHQAKGTFSWPFSKVLAVKGTVNLRNDRNIVKAIDDRSLQAEDFSSNWGGLKVELIYDDTRDKALNIKNGTRFKIFAESYTELASTLSDINILGADFRFYQKIHRNIIWANRIAGSTSFGKRKLVYYLGSVDEWMNISSEPRFNSEQNIARDQNFFWQALATNMRGFSQNIRNGNTFVVVNSELRIPIFQYLIAKPIKSEFIKNFQIIGFGDVGTAWTGPNPYSDENAFNTKTITTGGSDVTVRINNKKDPLVGGVGFGLRTKLMGYFLRFDYGWGIEDGIFLKPLPMLSLGLDF